MMRILPSLIRYVGIVDAHIFLGDHERRPRTPTNRFLVRPPLPGHGHFGTGGSLRCTGKEKAGVMLIHSMGDILGDHGDGHRELRCLSVGSNRQRSDTSPRSAARTPHRSLRSGQTPAGSPPASPPASKPAPSRQSSAAALLQASTSYPTHHDPHANRCIPALHVTLTQKQLAAQYSFCNFCGHQVAGGFSEVSCNKGFGRLVLKAMYTAGGRRHACRGLSPNLLKIVRATARLAPASQLYRSNHYNTSKKPLPTVACFHDIASSVLFPLRRQQTETK